MADLPLTQGRKSHLHELIDGSGFHLLVFGGGVDDGPLEEISRAYQGIVTIEQVSRSWLPAGTRAPAYVLVRPDGYIATAGDDSRAARAIRYLVRWVVPTTSRENASSRSDP
jgi:hypothetical protein